MSIPLKNTKLTICQVIIKIAIDKKKFLNILLRISFYNFERRYKVGWPLQLHILINDMGLSWVRMRTCYLSDSYLISNGKYPKVQLDLL